MHLEFIYALRVRQYDSPLFYKLSTLIIKYVNSILFRKILLITYNCLLHFSLILICLILYFTVFKSILVYIEQDGLSIGFIKQDNFIL